jgi:glycosyltransferase involved in cell wall biosynthesis
MSRLRVAIVADYPEEGWPSMDLVAEMVFDYLSSGHAREVEATRICPPYRCRLGRLPGRRLAHASRNADRTLNRHVDYPRHLRRIARGEPFDVYHIIDHSYAQLVRALPPGRAVVTCHDLDTFRCLLRPDLEPRPAWFRALARRTLRGLRSAAAVVCVSEATRSAILEHGLVPADCLSVNYQGIAPEFSAAADPAADAEVAALLGPADPAGPPELLHVGTTIPRKRIDVLLDVFAGIRRAIPGATLVKAGGRLTPEQAGRARALGVVDAIREMPFFRDRRPLAALYRRAALVLQPSEAEGFGLPLAEAMACGSPLLVSDLPVLREVAGDAALYRLVGDVPAWIEAALALLDDRTRRPDATRVRRDAGLARSAVFHWETHADRLVDLYREVAGRAGRMN